MNLRIATLIIGAFDMVAWVLLTMGTFLSQSDPATKDLDTLAGIVVTALFLLTGAPALVLAWRAIMLPLGLALAIAFPAAFAILFIGTVIALA